MQDFEAIYLGIDYGSKFTGTAIYRAGRDPFPLGLERLPTQDKNFLSKLRGLIQRESVGHIVLGIPYYPDGKPNVMTQRVRAFEKTLREYFSSDKNIQIWEQDETLSTFEAKERMRTSPLYNYRVDINKIDVLCAQIILEDFLKLKSPSSQNGPKLD